MNKLVLIDANAILHRAYHALPPLTTKKGELINAVYGFISMLLRVVVELKPTHIAVAFDRKEPTFRHQEFKAYQANRPEMDKELSGQLEKAYRVIDAFGMPIYSRAGFEADDIIGTLAKHKQVRGKIEEVVIITGDRDILQLVDNQVKVFLPKRGLKDAELLGRDEVVKRMGIAPEKIVDFKALCGDASDNYPGVPGIGPKTAISLLEKYGNLDRIYQHLNTLDSKVSQKLKDGRKSAQTSRKLAKIVTDVPLDFELEKASQWQVDNEKILHLFQDFGFKTLIKRVKKVGDQIRSRQQLTIL